MAAQRKAKKKAATKAKTGKAAASKSPARRKAAKKKPAAKKTAAKRPAAKKPAAKKAATKKPAAKKAKAEKPTRKAVKRTATREPSASRGTRKKKTTRAKARRKRPPLDLGRFRKHLLDKQKDLVQAYITSKGDSRNRQADGTEDYIDYAVSSYDREFLLSLSELEQQELMLVEEALKRIEQRSFGSCTQCGRHIAAKRLEVQPWARYCLRCQELAEQGLGRESFEAAIAADDLDAEIDEDIEYEDEEDDEEEEPDESVGKDLAIG
jgi:DnaK suppressor protein